MRCGCFGLIVVSAACAVEGYQTQNQILRNLKHPDRQKFGFRRRLTSNKQLLHAGRHDIFLTSLSNPSNLQAVAGLLTASSAGYACGTILPKSSILVALSTAAVIANLGLAPSQHAVYNLSWSTFLPASLVLLLLSLFIDKSQSLDDRKNSKIENSQSVVLRLTLPFFFASTGSLLGVLAAFGLTYKFPALIPMSPSDACTAAACLVSSFTGGSVNFFATAALVGKRNADVISSMAAADILVMAIYFAVLGGLAQSDALKTWFGNTDEAKESAEAVPRLENKVGTKDAFKNRLRAIRGSLLALAFSLCVVRVANRFEHLISGLIPGTACAFISIFVPLFFRLSSLPFINNLLKDMQRNASDLSNFMLLLLFAAIGMSADLSSALINGPACFIFTLIALIIHFAVSISGSYTARQWHWFRSIRFGDVLIASNAAIGGPATAAAFCGQISGPGKKALAVAATFWGIFGYAIGTTIGVTVFRMLERAI